MRMRPAIMFALSGVWWAVTPSLAQELEPGVQTSSAAAPVRGAPPASNTHVPAAKPKAQSAAPPAAAPRASDRIQLDTTQISGNRELPKVMYVVPWRRADPGDFSGRPPNSLLDEALTPVDRDVFRRQNRYFGMVQQQAQGAKSQGDAAASSSPPSAAKDEK